MWNLTLREPAFISFRNLAFLHKGEIIFIEALEIKTDITNSSRSGEKKRGKKQQNKSKQPLGFGEKNMIISKCKILEGCTHTVLKHLLHLILLLISIISQCL